MLNSKNKNIEESQHKINQFETNISELESLKLQSNPWFEESPLSFGIIVPAIYLQYMSNSCCRQVNIGKTSVFHEKYFPSHFQIDSFKIPTPRLLNDNSGKGDSI